MATMPTVIRIDDALARNRSPSITNSLTRNFFPVSARPAPWNGEPPAGTPAIDAAAAGISALVLSGALDIVTTPLHERGDSSGDLAGRIRERGPARQRREAPLFVRPAP